MCENHASRGRCAGRRGYTLILSLLLMSVMTAMGLGAVVAATSQGDLTTAQGRISALRRCADFGIARLSAAMPFPENLVGEREVASGYNASSGHVRFADTPRDPSGTSSLSDEFLAGLARRTYRNHTNTPQSAGGAPRAVVGRRVVSVCIGPDGVEHETEAALLYQAR